MFRSRTRPLIYTQYEHMRMAGALAQHWGNESFMRPALPFASFVAGVALHDFGYGLSDTKSIGEMDTDQSRAAMQQFIDCELPDKVSETVMKFHALRLMQYTNFDDLKTRCEQQIDTLIHATQIERMHYERADRITAFCDRLAFDFCFEKPLCDTLQVYRIPDHDSLTDIAYQLDESATVRLNPWPFATTSIQGTLIAFEADDYPHTLQPHVGSYRVEPAL